MPAANAIRLLPGVKRFDDGTTLDCPISDITLRRITDIREFKLYDQPNLELGRDNDFSVGIGTLKNIRFEDLTFTAPGKIEVHADTDGLVIQNVEAPSSRSRPIGTCSPSARSRMTYQGAARHRSRALGRDLLPRPRLHRAQRQPSPASAPQTRKPICRSSKSCSVIEQKLNPDYPKTTPQGGTGKGIWIR